MSTNCYAAEVLWDEEKAEVFRSLCQRAVGRDCLCKPGQPCPILPKTLTVVSAA